MREIDHGAKSPSGTICNWVSDLGICIKVTSMTSPPVRVSRNGGSHLIFFLHQEQPGQEWERISDARDDRIFLDVDMQKSGIFWPSACSGVYSKFSIMCPNQLAGVYCDSQYLDKSLATAKATSTVRPVVSTWPRLHAPLLQSAVAHAEIDGGCYGKIPRKGKVFDIQNSSYRSSARGEISQKIITHGWKSHQASTSARSCQIPGIQCSGSRTLCVLFLHLRNSRLKSPCRIVIVFVCIANERSEVVWLALTLRSVKWQQVYQLRKQRIPAERRVYSGQP